MSIRFFAVRQLFTPTGENGHALHEHYDAQFNYSLPTEAEMASMQLIVEGAGWLLECEGLTYFEIRLTIWLFLAGSSPRRDTKELRPSGPTKLLPGRKMGYPNPKTYRSTRSGTGMLSVIALQCRTSSTSISVPTGDSRERGSIFICRLQPVPQTKMHEKDLRRS
jgi:hypothetical protein